MAIATMTSKGQLTVPKTVRQELRLEPGDKVEFTLGPNGKAYMVKQRTHSIADIYRLLPKDSVALDRKSMRESAIDEVVAKVTKP